jgi:hypothetical protein
MAGIKIVCVTDSIAYTVIQLYCITRVYCLKIHRIAYRPQQRYPDLRRS